MKKLNRDKIIFIIIVIIIVVGGFIKSINKKPIVEIDDCEYLITRTVYGDFYEHKGDCKNPIHYSDSIKIKE